jgi:hypothetical protein
MLESVLSTVAIGRLLRSSTTGFVFGCSVPEPDVPRFGDFVKAPAQRGRTNVLGLIYDIVIEDDPFVRQMVATRDLDEAYILDQRENRQVPLEVSVLSIGYDSGGDSGPSKIVCGLPPQPPVTLDSIRVCTATEMLDCTSGFDYLRLIINSPEAPVDELIVVSLRNAAAARPPEDRTSFLRLAGRELAKLMSRDLPRLENLLRRIRP